MAILRLADPPGDLVGVLLEGVPLGVVALGVDVLCLRFGVGLAI